MEIGIDSFGAVISDPATGLTLSPVQRTQNLLEEIALADKVGLDVFGVGETLFGFDLDDYDSLFAEKFDLLLKIRQNTRTHWSGSGRG